MQPLFLLQLSAYIYSFYKSKSQLMCEEKYCSSLADRIVWSTQLSIFIGVLEKKLVMNLGKLSWILHVIWKNIKIINIFIQTDVKFFLSRTLIKYDQSSHRIFPFNDKLMILSKLVVLEILSILFSRIFVLQMKSQHFIKCSYLFWINDSIWTVFDSVRVRSLFFIAATSCFACQWGWGYRHEEFRYSRQ